MSKFILAKKAYWRPNFNHPKYKHKQVEFEYNIGKLIKDLEYKKEIELKLTKAISHV